MDWRKTLSKMGWDFVHTSCGIAAFAVVGYYSDPENLKRLLDSLPGPVAMAALPLVSAVIAGARNWLKNHDAVPKG